MYCSPDMFIWRTAVGHDDNQSSMTFSFAPLTAFLKLLQLRSGRTNPPAIISPLRCGNVRGRDRICERAGDMTLSSRRRVL
jgi:hypothetical protein